MKDILYFNTVEDIRLIDMLRVLKEHDYSKDYLTFEALENGTFTLSIPANVDSRFMTSISYSIDNGETWTTTNIDNTAQTITTPTINTGDKVLWKGIGLAMCAETAGSFSQSRFYSTGNFNVFGNIMSLLYGDDFIGLYSLPEAPVIPGPYTVHGRHFPYLFFETKIQTAENLILPATVLTHSCYYHMFTDCAILITAPELPAITLAEYCYAYMFSGCTNLNYIKAMFTTLVVSSTQNWVEGVAATGTFVKNANATWTTTGNNGVPTGWTVETADS